MHQVFAKQGIIDNTVIEYPFIQYDSCIRNMDTLVENTSQNSYLYPGLVNVHEHLRINCIGPFKTGQYISSKEWVDEHRQISRFKKIVEISEQNLLCLFGVYKNLFSGVTSLLNFGPVGNKIGEEVINKFPIEVIEKSENILFLDENRFPDIEKAISKGEILTIHIGEGVDSVTREELNKLSVLGGLTDSTLLIHGISFEENDFIKIQESGAAIAWCPKSNDFLIGKTLDIRNALRSGITVALSTDSTMSGSKNLFNEMRFAREYCKTKLKFDISPVTLFEMVTIHASKILKRDDIGILSPDSSADFFLTDILHEDIYESILACNPENIQLMVSRGIPVLGDYDILEKQVQSIEGYSEYFINQRRKLVLGNPLQLISQLKDILGFDCFNCF